VLEWHSPLSAAHLRKGRDGADGRRLVRFAEVRGWSLTEVGVLPGYDVCVAELLAAQVPSGSLKEARVYKIASNQSWIAARDLSLAATLTSALPEETCTVTSLTHGRVRIAIAGAPVRAVLAKVLSIDLRHSSFGVGEYRLTGLHHIGVFVERSDSDIYQFFLPRTFAQSLLEVLQDAALEFGYDVMAE